MATLTFDPTSEDATNSPLEVWNTSTTVTTAWSSPTPQLETATSGSIDTEGDLIAARRHQNRQVDLTLEVTAATAADARTAVGVLEAKIAKLSLEGGTLKWVNDDGLVQVFDILAAASYDKALDITYFAGRTAIATISLTAKPYLRGTKVTLTAHTEATLPVLMFTETGIAGDVPAPATIAISNPSGVPWQDYVVWGLESRYTATGTSLFLQAENADYASNVAVGPAGATGSGTNKVVSNSVGLADGIDLEHTFANVAGTFRVFGRAYLGTHTAAITTGLIGVNQRTVISNGDGGHWLLVDLGVVQARPDEQHSYRGLNIQVTSRSTTSGNQIYWDYILCVPVAEGSGQFTAFHGDSDYGTVGQKGEVGPDGVWQKDPSATIWMRNNSYAGDYPMIPPARAEGRTARFIVKTARRSSPSTVLTSPKGVYGDEAIDSLTAQVTYTPRYLNLR